MDPPVPQPDAETSTSWPDLDRLSIYQRARRLPRSRILVKPLFWTRLQLDLLGCTFNPPSLAPPVTTMKLEYPTDAKRQQSFKFAFTSGLRLPVYRRQAMCDLLGGPDGPMVNSSNLYFHFRRRRGIPLLCETFCLRRDYGEGGFKVRRRLVPPIVAHIDHDMIRERRAQEIMPLCDSERDLPAFAVARTRLKKLNAGDPLHDPYLVALLIALAQEQWGSLPPERQEQLSGVKPKVLYTSFGHPDLVYLYSAHISSALLTMFRKPAVAPATPQSLSIDITAIPFAPFDTLRDRIMALVLSATSLDSVGRTEDFCVF